MEESISAEDGDLNCIKHKPVRSYALALIQKIRKSTNLCNCWRWCWWSILCSTSRILSPMTPFLLRISKTSRCTTRWFTAILMAFKFISIIKLLFRTETQFWSWLYHPHGDWTLWQARQRLLLNLHQYPVNVTIVGSLARRNRILTIVKKGNCKAQTSWHCLEAEFKKDSLKYELYYQPI